MLFKRLTKDSEPPKVQEFVPRAGSGVDELLEQMTEIRIGLDVMGSALTLLAGNQAKLDFGIRTIGKTVTPIPQLLDEFGRILLQRLVDLETGGVEHSLVSGEQEGNQMRAPSAGVEAQFGKIIGELSSIRKALEGVTARPVPVNGHPQSPSPEGFASGTLFDDRVQSVFTTDHLIQRIKAYKREASEEITKGGRRLIRLSVEGKPHWYLVPTEPGDDLLSVMDDAIATRKQAECGPYFLSGAKKLSARQVPPGIWMVLTDESAPPQLSPNEWQKLSKLSRESGVMVLSPTYADNVGRVLLDHLEILKTTVEGSTVVSEPV